MSSKKASKTTTTSGWIDSASITQVVQAYEVGPKKESSPCGWTVPRLVTSLLMFTENMGLAPGTAERARSKIWSRGPIGDITRNLLRSGIMSRPALSDAVQKKVLQQTQHEIDAECENLRRRFNDLRQRSETQNWMDWGIRSAWEEHAENFGSLVDEALIPQLARILDVTVREVRTAHKETSKPETVKNLAKTET